MYRNVMAVALLGYVLAFGPVFGQAFGPAGCPAGQAYDDCNHTSTGPGPCIPGCIGTETPASPVGPVDLCIREECRPVEYQWLGNIAVAQSALPNGYAVLGWAGPCAAADGQCPDILNQAFNDLRTNALRANRAQEAKVL